MEDSLVDTPLEALEVLRAACAPPDPSAEPPERARILQALVMIEREYKKAQAGGERRKVEGKPRAAEGATPLINGEPRASEAGGKKEEEVR
jgi:hypothetical protein